MKHYKLGYYILIFSFIWTSCDNDDVAPEVEIISPLDNTTFNSSDVLTVEAMITDNKELDFVAIALTGPNDEIELRKIELTGDSELISEDFDLNYESDGLVSINIDAIDKSENRTTAVRNFDFVSFESNTIDFNIKLQYNGEPLVMFETYEYPDEKKMDFTRCSFYISELKLDETVINEVEFHNLTNSHSTPEGAADGYNWTVTGIPAGSYDRLSFNIGVPEDLNGQDPGDFPSGHPLAKPAENWFSWMSYIFLKIEGNIDLDADDIAEEGIALHTGANDALRNFEFDYPFEVVESGKGSVNLIFDIYDLFQGENRLFPIEETPQIHSLSQIDAVVELSNNLKYSINKI